MANRSHNLLRTQLGSLTKATRAARQPESDIPALMLVYATIDIMAWLDRPVGRADVSRDDFVAWATEYVLKNSGLTCSALDLYAARCSLLHSYTADSSLSRSGAARKIIYAFEPPLTPAGAAQLPVAPDTVIVDPAQLIAAVDAGIERYLAVLSSDSGHRAYERAEQFYVVVRVK